MLKSCDDIISRFRKCALRRQFWFAYPPGVGKGIYLSAACRDIAHGWRQLGDSWVSRRSVVWVPQ
uniref:Uncharacterized protein n=1 Tax=Timema genevievae TaxID=629358 RepID=A0A7R9JWN4_TIMGE|nr:unnamed protein product [Timema genevievae]